MVNARSSYQRILTVLHAVVLLGKAGAQIVDYVTFAPLMIQV